MATGQDRIGMKPLYVEMRKPKVAAGINWKTAQHYCQWLGQQLNVPMSLPTEAQWEYAARNRGEYVLFPTDNGKVDAGRNVTTFKQKKELSKRYDTMFDIPLVGTFPPNPIGLYDLINQNYEWTMDWYAADYYERSPELNPQGPDTGTEKVVRALSPGEGSAENIRGIGSITVKRSKRLPDPPLINNNEDLDPNRPTSSRCIANSTQPIS